MDIQVSSNFERLLFELKERDGAAVAAALAEFRRSGSLPASACRMARGAGAVPGLPMTMPRRNNRCRRPSGDRRAARSPQRHRDRRRQGGTRRASDVPMVALACAHPAKFPEAVGSDGHAAGPAGAAWRSLQRPERRPKLANDLGAVEDYVALRGRTSERHECRRVTTPATAWRVVTDHVPTSRRRRWASGSMPARATSRAADQWRLASLEHMAFKGTERRSARQIAEEIEAVGGHSTPIPRATTPPTTPRC